jgi:hypothetical protein
MKLRNRQLGSQTPSFRVSNKGTSGPVLLSCPSIKFINTIASSSQPIFEDQTDSSSDPGLASPMQLEVESSQAGADVVPATPTTSALYSIELQPNSDHDSRSEFDLQRIVRSPDASPPTSYLTSDPSSCPQYDDWEIPDNSFGTSDDPSDIQSDPVYNNNTPTPSSPCDQSAHITLPSYDAQESRHTHGAIISKTPSQVQSPDIAGHTPRPIIRVLNLQGRPAEIQSIDLTPTKSKRTQKKPLRSCSQSSSSESSGGPSPIPTMDTFGENRLNVGKSSNTNLGKARKNVSSRMNFIGRPENAVEVAATILSMPGSLSSQEAANVLLEHTKRLVTICGKAYTVTEDGMSVRVLEGKKLSVRHLLCPLCLNTKISHFITSWAFI